MTKQARNGMGLTFYNQNQIIIEVVQGNLKSFSQDVGVETSSSLCWTNKPW